MNKEIKLIKVKDGLSFDEWRTSDTGERISCSLLSGVESSSCYLCLSSVKSNVNNKVILNSDLSDSNRSYFTLGVYILSFPTYICAGFDSEIYVSIKTNL